MDIKKEELAKIFTRTTVNIFETFSILHILTNPELDDEMSFKELDMTLSRGGTFLHIEPFQTSMMERFCNPLIILVKTLP